ncbi:MAG: magnesium transporter [Eubacteriales bacterium]|nr:magnesium transporter [Eubacteriales bacterium]
MKLTKETIVSLIDHKDYRRLQSLLARENEADIAEVTDELNSERAITTFRLLPKDRAAEVFAILSPEHRQSIINSITDKELQGILNDMFIDDAVDVIEELPAGIVRRVLENTDPQTRRLINRFLKYPEDSAGSIMTAEYIGLKKHMTVSNCFDYIRAHAITSETIYTCYVTNDTRQIEGVVTIKDLFLADDDAVIADIMDTNVITAHTHDDREAVVDMLNKYDFLSLPVVDNEDRLVGIITIDDALDVMEQEATEDFEKMAAMAPSERPYLRTNAFALAKNRILWLAVLMFADMIAGIILHRYEEAFQAIPLLVSFIPMLIDTGGNAGSQSATMIIRGMAVGEITLKDFFRVVFKEFQVGLLTGSVLVLINYIRLSIMYPGKTMIILTIILSIYIIVILSKMLGAVLPMIAKACHVDPAIMAAPMIATIVDGLGLLLYFELATFLLHL